MRDKVIITRQLRRKQIIDFFSKDSPLPGRMEACGTAHCWAREVSKRLMPRSYVRGYGRKTMLPTRPPSVRRDEPINAGRADQADR